MAISAKTSKIVWVKARGYCAICREFLLLPGTAAVDGHLVGDVAHIVAERDEGPRGRSSLTLDERNSEPNLLLLCLPHHKIVDDDPSAYTVEQLVSIKAAHQTWLTSLLSIQSPWQTKLYYLYYLNLPRLSVLAALNGQSLDTARFQNMPTLHEAGWDLNGLMSTFRSVLEGIEVGAADLQTAINRSEIARGSLVAFDQEFRTKNITRDARVTGNLAKDPHIYVRLGEHTAFLPVDPRWITTSTAFVLFRPSSGRERFAGLGVVNSYDETAKRLMISPLVIGLPKSPLHEALFGGGNQE